MALAVGGCGDDAAPGDDADGGDSVADVPGDGDAGADANADGDGDAWTPGSATLVVLTSDYASGGIALVNLDTLESLPNAATVHSDASLRCGAGGTFDVVERTGSDRIRRFHLSGAAVVEGASLAFDASSNPQDAAPLSTGEIAVPLYESALLAFAAGDLSARGATTDLESLADTADGLPEMYRAVEASGRLFVSLQLLDRSGTTWTPTGPGVLAVVDPVAHELIDMDGVADGTQGVVLAGENPFGPMRVAGTPARVLLSDVGEYGVLDGGIESVDPAAGESSGFVVTEVALGGDLSDWVITDDGETGFALVVTPAFADNVVRFDPAAGTVDATPLATSGGYTLSGLALVAGNRLAVGDRTVRALPVGIRLFDAVTGAETTTVPIATALPPVQLCQLLP